MKTIHGRFVQRLLTISKAYLHIRGGHILIVLGTLLTMWGAVSVAAPLPAGTKLSVTAGSGSGFNQRCTVGSCFAMETTPGLFYWSDVTPGLDGGIIVGKQQSVWSGPIIPEANPCELAFVTVQAGATNCFVTAPAAETNVFDDASCDGTGCIGKTEIKSLSLTGIGGLSGSCPVGRICPGVQKWAVTASAYSLDYAWAITDGSFMGFRIYLHMAGDIIPIIVPTVAADDVSVFEYAEPNDIVRIWFPKITNSGTGKLVCSISSAASYQNNYAIVADDCMWGAYVNKTYPYYFVDSFAYQACNDTSCDTGQVNLVAGTVHTYPLLASLDMLLATEQDKSVNWQPAPTMNVLINPSTLQLSYTIVSQPKHGTATAPTATAPGLYTPSEGYVGSDYFEYRMSSNQTSGSNGIVAVTVNPPSVRLVVGPVEIDGPSGALIPWTPLVTSSLITPTPTCLIKSLPSNGIATVSADCSTGTYQSNPGFIGTDSFIYQASVCTSQCYDGFATVTVAVTEPPPADPCLAQYPVSQFTQTGKDGTITIGFTGNITTHTSKEVKVCPGTTLKYTTTSTQGPVICKVKNNTTRGSGSLKINDNLKCTDKPAGKDKVHFKVKSGVK